MADETSRKTLKPVSKILKEIYKGTSSKLIFVYLLSDFLIQNKKLSILRLRLQNVQFNVPLKARR